MSLAPYIDCMWDIRRYVVFAVHIMVIIGAGIYLKREGI